MAQPWSLDLPMLLMNMYRNTSRKYHGSLEERARRHEFNRVQTPIFESLELFTAKSGEGVISQLYAFEDKGGRKE
jgi:histidyl-tRNA synthetase